MITISILCEFLERAVSIHISAANKEKGTVPKKTIQRNREPSLESVS